MRKWMTLCEMQFKASESFDGVVYHCSDVRFDTFRVNPNRGVYFANEPDSEYGRYIYKCHVTLDNAAYDLSTDNFEIDRNELIQQGYDGRIVDYCEESDVAMLDIIAFHGEQIKILEVTERN